MLTFKINNYFGMNFFCNNANSDISVFFTNSFKEREKKYILRKNVSFYWQSVGVLLLE
jgi:hypothetical protein